MPRNPRIDFVFFDAGGGHRSAALALQAIIAEQQRPWDVRLMNLQDVLDELDPFRRMTGIRMQDNYNLLLQRGWTFGTAQMLKGIQQLIRLFHKVMVRRLADYWRANPPELVVSLVPNFNRALYQGLRLACPDSPYVTILTDFADYPPHFWIEQQDQYLVCGTAKAVEQARAAGFDSERIFATSGMILRPSFYCVPPIDVAAERTQHGLDPGLATGLVMFGGHGSGVMLGIAERLQRGDQNVQLILMTGRNERLTRKLQQVPARRPVHIQGFTPEVPRFMQMADFFIGKPGPGSISEALAMGLPVLVERNAWTMPQERYNAEWVTERDVGLVVPSFQQVEAATVELTGVGRLAALRARVAQIDNRAVFEIPPFLESLL